MIDPVGFIQSYYTVSENDGKFTYTPKVEFLLLGRGSKIKLEPVTIEDKDRQDSLNIFSEKFTDTINNLK